MGREIKRVPLDFDWPLDKTWPGYCYVDPDCGVCPPEEEWAFEKMCIFHRMLWDDYKLSPSIDPPSGDGWQLWETVSEGSPISPVFATKEELSAWMQSPDYHWGSSRPLTKTEADRFVDVGWAASAVYTPATGLIPGDQLA